MSTCLCCGKALRSVSSEKTGWHTSCVKKFFGTKDLPDIDISEETLKQLAIDSTNKGFTVPGVQKKLSLHLTQEDTPRLTFVNYPTGYILKPQTEEYRALPELEYLIMRMAVATGIKTVPFALLRLSSQKNMLAYITKRIDREFGQILAMEDFCQLEYRLTEDKYRGSYERCGKIISKYSANVGIDQSELFLRVIFSFAVGNSDMHLKNLSLIETHEGSGEYVLSAAYDLLSANVVMPSDSEQLALTLNGKRKNIRKKDFLTFAEVIGVPKVSAEKMIVHVVKLHAKYIEMCRNSWLPIDMKEDLERLIDQRIDVMK